MWEPKLNSAWAIAQIERWVSDGASGTNIVIPATLPPEWAKAVRWGFIPLLGVAVRSPRRGVFLALNNRPHNVKSLAMSADMGDEQVRKCLSNMAELGMLSDAPLDGGPWTPSDWDAGGVLVTKKGRDDVVIPAVLNTPEFAAALDKYQKHRLQNNWGRAKSAELGAKMKEWADYPVAEVVAALGKSVQCGWRGVFVGQGGTPDRLKPQTLWGGAGETAGDEVLPLSKEAEAAWEEYCRETAAGGGK